MKRLMCILAIPLAIGIAQQRVGYYRMPALHGTSVVFTSEGDLWTVGIDGGIARRLTTHQGLETRASISPDGSLIAFSAQYEGPVEVYTMPLAGGLPTRRSFAGRTTNVVGWTSDGKVLAATEKYSTLPNWQLISIDLRDNSETVLPLAQASQGSFESTGATLFFTRLAFQGSYTKRYKGGTAQNLWKFTGGSIEAVPLTADYPGTSKDAMWWSGRVYFVSDRDGTMNIWSMKEDGSDLKQHTRHDGFDVSYPALDNGRIVYQLVADLRLFDISSGTDRKIDIALSSDFDQMREKWVTKPMDYLSSAHVSPDGDRVVLTSRGNVFVLPSEQGRIVRVSRQEGIRNRIARFFPDGKSLMVISDQSGENEFHRMPANGVGTTEQLTSGGTVIRFDGIPSPDGTSIAFADKDLKLWIHNIDKKETKKIATSEWGMFFDLAWSPDSKWLAYVENTDNLNSTISLYSVEKGTNTELTNDRTDSWNPAWSTDGKWLYFLSDRTFASVVGSPWGPRQPEPFFDKTTKIYALGMTADEWFPFLPENELRKKPAEKKDEKETKEKKDEKETKAVVTIALEGIQDRLYEVPLPAGRYGELSAIEKVLFVLDSEVGIGAKRKLLAVDIKNDDVKTKTLVEDVSGYERSPNNKKLLVQKGNDLYVIDAGSSTPSSLAEKKVDLSKWTFSIQPREEWRQMFRDAWRLERDYFYDRNMHGIDYEGLFKRYVPFVDRVTDRDELSDLFGHLVGELSALHIYVSGGDLRRGDDNVAAGSLGARLVKDEKRKGWRIDHIYRTSPEYPSDLSPLARPYLGVKEGDVIVSINGVPTLSVDDPAILLRNTVGQQVLLEVQSATSKTTSTVMVEPISSAAEANLRYDEWEYTRRLQVDKESANQIGYVHLRAMGGGNYTEWVKNFYPVFHRKGLIIDVRHNRGGNIDSWILGKLLRKAWFYWQPRVGSPYWNMQYAFRGHMVVLCNERTASDGEAFAEGFRRLGMGPVIGTRTWGGEIWLSSSNRLVDKGIATAAETGVYGPERVWLIEGHGVDPDFVVDNLPHAAFNGKDAQLEAAIKFLKEKIAKEPVPVPSPPPYPKK